MRRRVWEAAHDLGYQGQSEKQTTRQALLKNFRQICLFTLLPSHLDPFHGRILEGIEAACRDLELNLSVAFIEPQLDPLTFVSKKIATQHYDDLLFMSINDNTLPHQLKDQGIEAVFVNTDLPDLGFDTYLIDNWHGSLIALEHLFEQGHRDILHINYLERTTLRRRFYAYQSFMIERTGIYRPELFISCPLVSLTVYEVMSQRLKTNGLDFSAIFCANDTAALGAIKALQDAGFDVPRDVSVIGFDNIDNAAFTSPPLTTIHADLRYLGKLALQGAVNRFLSPGSPPIRVEISPVLIKRQSVALRK